MGMASPTFCWEGGPGNNSILNSFLSNAGGTTTPGLSLDTFGAILNGIFVAGAPG